MNAQEIAELVATLNRFVDDHVDMVDPIYYAYATVLDDIRAEMHRRDYFETDQYKPL